MKSFKLYLKAVGFIALEFAVVFAIVVFGLVLFAPQSWPSARIAADVAAIVVFIIIEPVFRVRRSNEKQALQKRTEEILDSSLALAKKYDHARLFIAAFTSKDGVRAELKKAASVYLTALKAAEASTRGENSIEKYDDAVKQRRQFDSLRKLAEEEGHSEIPQLNDFVWSGEAES